MKILVLGGAGYVGSTLTSHLLAVGHEVTVLDQMMFGGESVFYGAGQLGPRVERGDIRDSSLLHRIMPGHDAVVLLAAIVGEPACNRAPNTARSINFDGACLSLDVARKCDIERFVFASTCSNYGVTNEHELVDESTPLKPISVYSETKVSMEQSALREHSRSNMSTSILRLSTAFGVSRRMRFDLLVSDFALQAFRHQKIVIYGEQFWRPFVHINDIALATEVVLKAPRERVAGQVFNVGRNDNNIQKIQLAEMVSQELGGVTIEVVKRDTDPRSYRVCFDKVEQQLGFRANWSVHDGVREILEHLKKRTWHDPSDTRFTN
jgi:nucleoside-diphosphate-sugar epimerase